jgi:hypothetical protein
MAGTASDAGGGVVGGVEISLDAGRQWHPANGREQWTYEANVPPEATLHILVRAVDDSGNLESPGRGITVAVARTSSRR